MDNTGSVYLIHFHEKLSGHAQHYLGFAKDVGQRLKRHRAGNGSKIMAAVTEAGIDWECARIWSNVDRKFERKLKNRKKTKDLCPICKGGDV